jgi:hypothetical protein
MKTIEVQAKFMSYVAAQMEKLGAKARKLQEDTYWDSLTMVKDKVRAFNPTNNGKHTTVRLSNIEDCWIIDMPYTEFRFLFNHPVLYKIRKYFRQVRNKIICWNISGDKISQADVSIRFPLSKKVTEI